MAPKRCTECQKKLGLTAFPCRCGSHFCAEHIYAEAHKCTYDYRAAAVQRLSTINQVVVGDKMTERL